MAQNDIRRLSVGNGRVIELKEDSGALFAREVSEWGFEEVADVTALPGYASGVRAEYRINGGNIERREAQEAAWENVIAVSALTLTAVEAYTPPEPTPAGMTLVYAARIDSGTTDSVDAEYQNGITGTWNFASGPSFWTFTANEVFSFDTILPMLTIGPSVTTVPLFGTVKESSGGVFTIRVQDAAGNDEFPLYMYFQIWQFPPAE